jgi:aspartate 1-decarboxylase
LAYTGSITIDKALLDLVDLWEGQKVLVVDATNGARLETYVIVGEKNSGIICMNGAAAHLIKKGDEITIMGFEFSDKPIKAKKILVDKENKFVREL